MSAIRRRKFLVVVDETPECRVAMRFAARRAEHTGGVVSLAHIMPLPDTQQWAGVEELMRAEAEAEAEALIAAAAVSVRALAGLEPEKVVRTGLKSDEVVKLIEADEDISLLVLAAGTGSNGPGPLVSALAGKSAGTFPIPVAIVPGHLADEEIDALA